MLIHVYYWWKSVILYVLLKLCNVLVSTSRIGRLTMTLKPGFIADKIDVYKSEDQDVVCNDTYKFRYAIQWMEIQYEIQRNIGKTYDYSRFPPW